jgi:hypothetical protein
MGARIGRRSARQLGTAAMPARLAVRARELQNVRHQQAPRRGAPQRSVVLPGQRARPATVFSSNFPWRSVSREPVRNGAMTTSAVSHHRKAYVLDTNVLLHDPNAILSFEEHQVIIPIVVLEDWTSSSAVAATPPRTHALRSASSIASWAIALRKPSWQVCPSREEKPMRPGALCPSS